MRGKREEIFARTKWTSQMTVTPASTARIVSVKPYRFRTVGKNRMTNTPDSSPVAGVRTFKELRHVNIRWLLSLMRAPQPHGKGTRSKDRQHTCPHRNLNIGQCERDLENQQQQVKQRDKRQEQYCEKHSGFQWRASSR
ncbi:hypothetical protein KKH27_00120 [bacterium]|nr:hypothetical protein [bacterium]MBU1984830.1 hypothetical protein [bacterium]